MEKRMHLYVTRKSALLWIGAVLLLLSAVSRIWLCVVGTIDVSRHFWAEAVLPVAATALYLVILLGAGKEFFYKTAIAAWLMALYAGIAIGHRIPSRMIVWLFWTALVFFALLYTELTAGTRYHAIWVLFFVVLAPLGVIGYYQRRLLYALDWRALLPLTPDALALLAVAIVVLSIRVHPLGEYHPTWGDRSDGRRLRTLPALNQVSPYIMVERNGSTNTFEDSLEITAAERYIRQKRKDGYTNFGITHVLIACYCRALAKYPGLNRFISGQKIYSRGEDVQFCMTIKKEMTVQSPETEIKVHFSPRDTAADVYRKMNEAIAEGKKDSLDSDFDNTAHALMLMPGVFLKFVVWLLKTADYFGLLPKFLLEVSPFHGSVFFTSMGSLGIPPVYHHLYNFGNLPVFVSFGCKRRANQILDDGTVVPRKYIDVKFSMDERTVDGFYYAAFFKYYKRILAHPEVLDNPPEEVIPDID